MIITDKLASVLALADEMGRHRRFIYMTMEYVETVVVHPGAERLPGFSHILETTPPALNKINYVGSFAGREQL